jgi:hypothetical protein
VIGDAVTYDVHWYPWVFQLFGSDQPTPLPTPDSPPYCPYYGMPDPGVPLSPPPFDPNAPLSPPTDAPQSPPPGPPSVWPQSPPAATIVALQEIPLSPPPASPPPVDVPLSPPELSPPPSPPATIIGCPVPGGAINPPDTGGAGLKSLND